MDTVTKVRDELLRLHYEDGLPYRAIAKRMGLPERSNAVLAKIVNESPVSRDTLLRVGRALGVEPPPRTRYRAEMTPEQFAAWHALTPAERNERLGV